MANSDRELSGSVNRLLAETKSRPTESITISEMSTRPAQKSEDFRSPIYSFQAQLNQQSSSIQRLTKAIEKLANSQLTQQGSIEHIHYGQSTETKSSRRSPTAGSSTERSVSKTNTVGLVANVSVAMWKISRHTLSLVRLSCRHHLMVKMVGVIKDRKNKII